MNKQEEYVKKVCRHIHYKKLRNRISKEINDHMQDIYDDISSEHPNNTATIDAVITQMGDPNELGMDLKQANRKILIPHLILKICMAFLIIVSIPFIFYGIVTAGDEITIYNHAEDIKTMERIIANDLNGGEPIKLVAEVETNGYLHKYYIPVEKTTEENKLFETHSIKLFGISLYDKFASYGGSIVDSSDNNMQLCTIGGKYYNNWCSNDYLWIITGETKEKYVKRYYEPIDSNSGLEPYWSDFMPIPQNATYETPIVMVEYTPEGYEWSEFMSFDENKKEIVYYMESYPDNLNE